MKKLWTSHEVTLALKQEEFGKFWAASGLSIDSRTTQKGDLFIALKGDRTDGHQYLKSAMQQGAIACIVKEKSEDIPFDCQVQVPDADKALIDLGAFARTRAIHAKVVAITGSMGKTSVKEMIRHICGSVGETAYSQKSYNNHWGVPLSLATMSRECEYGVFEVGMNHVGEIAPLSKQIKPHVAVITAIGEAHIGPMGSVDAIAQEKATIFEGLVKDGIAILNADSPYFDYLCEQAKSKGARYIKTFGKSVDADMRLMDYQNHTPQSYYVSAQFQGKEFHFTFNFPGNHGALNALCAILTCNILGISVEQSIEALSTLRPPEGRGIFFDITLPTLGNVTILDEAYNANPSSMEAALRVLVSCPTSSRRIAVLGDMMELGDKSAYYHEKLSTYLNDHAIDKVILFGKNMKVCYDALDESKKLAYFEEVTHSSADAVLTFLENKDLVLFKGSRSTNLWKIVDALKGRQLSPSISAA